VLPPARFLVEYVAADLCGIWGCVYFTSQHNPGTAMDLSYSGETQHHGQGRDSISGEVRAGGDESMSGVSRQTACKFVPYIVRHVCNHIFRVERSFLYSRGRRHMIVLLNVIGPFVQRLGQRASQDLVQKSRRLTPNPIDFAQTFMRQCEFAWSCMGLPLPAVQTRMSCKLS
jgi:hypothetical protein